MSCGGGGVYISNVIVTRLSSPMSCIKIKHGGEGFPVFSNEINF